MDRRGRGTRILGGGHVLGVVGVGLAVGGEGGSATTLLRLEVKGVGGCCWRLGHGLAQEGTEAGTECLIRVMAELYAGRTLTTSASQLTLSSSPTSNRPRGKICSAPSPIWYLVVQRTSLKHHLTALGRPPSACSRSHASRPTNSPSFVSLSSSGDRQLRRRVSFVFDVIGYPRNK